MQWIDALGYEEVMTFLRSTPANLFFKDTECTLSQMRSVPRKLSFSFWSYGCLLCSILVPYDHYTSLSSFVTDELTGFYIFCIFPEVNLFSTVPMRMASTLSPKAASRLRRISMLNSIL